VRWRRTRTTDPQSDEAAPELDDSAAFSPSAVDVAEPAGESTTSVTSAHAAPVRPVTHLGVEFREDYGLAEETPWPRGRQSYLDEPSWAAQPTPRRTNFYAR
jgi:hypothetical protein